jgi:hypothetical protein
VGWDQKSSNLSCGHPLPQRASEKSKAVLISQSLSSMFKQALPLLRFSSLRSTSSVASFSIVQQRCFLSTPYKMSDLTIDLTAPNGKKFTLPTGIFIDNEFVKSKSGEKITSINPTLATFAPLRILATRTLLMSTTIQQREGNMQRLRSRRRRRRCCSQSSPKSLQRPFLARSTTHRPRRPHV